MKASDDLFLLIKSLSSSEKRHFKLYASKYSSKEQNNYVKLFDSIDRQSEYDEVFIRKKFRKERFIKQLHVTKNYLYHLILKSLREYHLNDSIDIALKGYMQDVEILFNTKALFKQCRKILHKTKKIAHQYEKHLTLLEIMEWEYKIAFAEEDFETMEENMSVRFDDEVYIIKQHQNKREYQQLHTRFFTRSRKQGIVRNLPALETLKEYTENPLLKNESTAISHLAKFYYYHLYANLSDNKRDFETGYIYSKKALEIIEDNMEIAKDDSTYYFRALHSFLSITYRLKKYTEFELALNKLKTLPQKLGVNSNYIQLRVFKLYYLSELYHLRDIGEFEKGLELIPDIEQGLKKFGNTVAKDIVIHFYFNIAYMYFATKRFKEALIWTNKLINDINTETREDIYCFARIINLIIHFELQNDDLLGYIIKSTYRFLYKRKRLYQFETIVLQFIKKLPEVKNQKDLLKEFIELKKRFDLLSNDPFEYAALTEYIDFYSWIESKIENKPFGEIVKEKAIKF